MLLYDVYVKKHLRRIHVDFFSSVLRVSGELENVLEASVCRTSRTSTMGRCVVGHTRGIPYSLFTSSLMFRPRGRRATVAADNGGSPSSTGSSRGEGDNVMWLDVEKHTD